MTRLLNSSLGIATREFFFFRVDEVRNAKEEKWKSRGGEEIQLRRIDKLQVIDASVAVVVAVLTDPRGSRTPLGKTSVAET